MLGDEFRQEPLASAGPATNTGCSLSAEERAQPEHEFGEYIFPNIDRILSRALGSANVLVQEVVNSGWLCNPEALGPAAVALKEQFTKMESEAAWEGLSRTQREVQKFVALLTAAQMRKGRGECSLWIGL